MQQNFTSTNDPVKDRISNTFILKDHLTAIEEASKKLKFALTFREAGAPTLDKLKLGAAAKGHDILEKTIKELSIQKSYKGNPQEVLQWMRNAEIEGYVGHWDKNTGLLKGIYLSEHVQGAKNVEDDLSHFYWPVDATSENSLRVSLLGLKNQKNWKKIPFTGDYDMHDIITFRSGRARTVMIYKDETPSITEEIDIINSINRSIAAKRDPKGQFDADSIYNPIRHGAQVNFPSYMMMFERDEVENDKGFNPVALAGKFPLAAINKGKWSIIEDLSQLLKFYKDCGVNMKETWKPDGLSGFLPIEGNPDRVYRAPRNNNVPDQRCKGFGRTPILQQEKSQNFFDGTQPLYKNPIIIFEKSNRDLVNGIQVSPSDDASKEQSKAFNQNLRTVLEEIQNQNVSNSSSTGRRKPIDLKKTKRFPRKKLKRIVRA